MGSRKKLLVVEDNQDNAKLLQIVFERFGYEVQVAYSGQEALDQIKKDHPDVLLCDIGLPEGLSGYDVARSIRNELGFKNMFLIALSGYAQREDKECAEKAGFNIHFAKPVDFNAIHKVIDSIYN